MCQILCVNYVSGRTHGRLNRLSGQTNYTSSHTTLGGGIKTAQLCRPVVVGFPPVAVFLEGQTLSAFSLLEGVAHHELHHVAAAAAAAVAESAASVQLSAVPAVGCQLEHRYQRQLSDASVPPVIHHQRS